MADVIRLVLIILLAYFVRWMNGMLPGPFSLPVDEGFYGAVVLLAILWFLVQVLTAALLIPLRRR